MVLFFIFLPVNVNTAPVKRWVPRICSRAPRDWFDGEQAWTEAPSLPGTVLLYACCSRVPPHLRLHSPTFPGLDDAPWNRPEGGHFPSPGHHLKELMCTGPFVWMKDENCLGGWAWVRPRKGAHSRLCCLHRNHRLNQRLKALHSWGDLWDLGEKGRLRIFWWTQRQHLDRDPGDAAAEWLGSRLCPRALAPFLPGLDQRMCTLFPEHSQDLQ